MGSMIPTGGVALQLAIAFVVVAEIAAEESEPAPPVAPQAERPPALRHDHSGLLEEKSFPPRPLAPGLTFEMTYTSDYFVNARGARSTNNAFQYRGLLNVAMTLDTEEMGWWDGGTLYINFIDNHGRDITERYVGDLQALNNADAPNDSRIYEAWYEQRMLENKFRLKLGKMDMNGDFAAGWFRGEFIHSSPGFSPTIPLLTWPETAWGAALLLEPAEYFYLNAGVFDALGTSRRVGFDTAFHAPDDVLLITEMGLRPVFRGIKDVELPGQYSFGAWHHTGTFPVFFNDLDSRLPARMRRGNSGFYVTIDQWLLRTPAASDDAPERGVGMFFQFGWAPSDRSEIVRHVGGGFEWYGPLESRPLDVLGFGVHHIELNSTIRTLEDRHAETAAELFYKFQMTDWLSIKPDLQFIANPGGDGRDALIFGIRVEVAL